MITTRTATPHLSLAPKRLCACLIALGVLSALPAWADAVPQALPFSQDWSNGSLITSNADWSLVPGIVGLRGDSLTSATGADPQTILTAGTPVVDVQANQTAPNTFNTGGVAEFAIRKSVV